uniref:Uncharacterized protein n=1 Tax=Myoviridae sp. ctk251 TaxID=2826689 RepID=A0A8S5MT04_9CAUD|nr:MAG TPA: hypothetical protein [Myoviridae sp. ctk251]
MLSYKLFVEPLGNLRNIPSTRSHQMGNLMVVAGYSMCRSRTHTKLPKHTTEI